MERGNSFLESVDSTTQVGRLQSRSWVDDILIRICTALQLTPSQYREAESHYSAVANWLAEPESALGTVRQDIFPQGSLRIGTTVRPLLREEYDLDLVLWLELDDGIDPVYLLDMVEKRFLENGTYAAMVERKNRCIRLAYAGQFHLDILPARPDQRLGGTHVLVPDHAAACWKESNPKGYAAWFEERGRLILALDEKLAMTSIEPLPLPEEARDKNALQLTVQLLKRWRDQRFLERPNLAPISIVLTTLAGNFYSGEDCPFEALCAIVEKINNSLPATGRLKVLNPANSLEDLSERWDDEPRSYRAFVEAMCELNLQLSAISQSDGIPAKTRDLEALFGKDIVQTALRSHALALEMRRSKGVAAVTRTGALTSVGSSSVSPVIRHTFYGE